MISQLRGRVILRQPNHIVLDVGGVGYGLTVPLSTYTRLKDATGETTLLTHTHMSQDRLELFGFSTDVEKTLFGLLLTVSGIGPRLAINILSGISPEELTGAIEGRDEARLSRVPGIGRKLAARLVVELQDKLKKLTIERTASGAGVRDDLLSALVNLGYPEPRAARAVEGAAKVAGIEDFEEMLKRALTILAR